MAQSFRESDCSVGQAGELNVGDGLKPTAVELHTDTTSNVVHYDLLISCNSVPFRLYLPIKMKFRLVFC